MYYQYLVGYRAYTLIVDLQYWEVSFVLLHALHHTQVTLIDRQPQLVWSFHDNYPKWLSRNYIVENTFSWIRLCRWYARDVEQVLFYGRYGPSQCFIAWQEQCLWSLACDLDAWELGQSRIWGVIRGNGESLSFEKLSIPLIKHQWPYSYDTCDVGTLANQTLNGQPAAAHEQGPDKNASISQLPGQRLSRCTCPGEQHPGPKHNDGSFYGRSAPEIDMFEAQVDGTTGAVSQSAQWAVSYFRFCILSWIEQDCTAIQQCIWIPEHQQWSLSL